jgi:hypothetical protein
MALLPRYPWLRHALREVDHPGAWLAFPTCLAGVSHMLGCVAPALGSTLCDKRQSVFSAPPVHAICLCTLHSKQSLRMTGRCQVEEHGAGRFLKSPAGPWLAHRTWRSLFFKPGPSVQFGSLFGHRSMVLLCPDFADRRMSHTLT